MGVNHSLAAASEWYFRFLYKQILHSAPGDYKYMKKKTLDWGEKELVFNSDWVN